MIDRTGPTRRPDQRVAGYQKWRHLLFLHWQIPVDILRPMVPEELTLDVHEGIAYIGVVPFVMQDVRPWRWWPTATAFHFLETNVRTYVHCQGRPGVYFFSLDAGSRLAVSAARHGWGLPYHFAQMKIQQHGEQIHYETIRNTGPRHTVNYRIGPALESSQPDSLEFFLLERYLLFVQRNQRVFVGQVHHRPYPARQATLLNVHDELIAASGLPQPEGDPCCVHYAEGVDVDIFNLKPL